MRLSNIECKAWFIEILTHTYFAFLFCDRAPTAEIDSNLKIPLNLRDCLPGQGQLLQIVKARLWLAKRREWNGVFRQAGVCGEERKDKPKSACGGGYAERRVKISRSSTHNHLLGDLLSDMFPFQNNELFGHARSGEPSPNVCTRFARFFFVLSWVDSGNRNTLTSK